jgi:membrane protease YdiL (CAAX protease family)
LGIDLFYGVFSAAVMVVVLAYTWVLAPITPPGAATIAGVMVVGLAAAHAMKTREWGVTPRAFAPALAASAAFTAAGALAIYLVAQRMRTWHDGPDIASTLLALVPWGFGQQFALQTLFLREAQAITSRPAGIWLAAAMFAALHLPNPFLTVATGVTAVVWCWIYDRYPNLLPLALSHAVLTLIVLYAFDDAVTGRLRVGAAYLALN